VHVASKSCFRGCHALMLVNWQHCVFESHVFLGVRVVRICGVGLWSVVGVVHGCDVSWWICEGLVREVFIFGWLSLLNVSKFDFRWMMILVKRRGLETVRVRCLLSRLVKFGSDFGMIYFFLVRVPSREKEGKAIGLADRAE